MIEPCPFCGGEARVGEFEDLIMEYRKKNDIYIFNKEGVYFSLTEEQVTDMRKTLQNIEMKIKKSGCVVNCTIDGDEETLPNCTWDGINNLD
jgi:hypothetical protein